MGKIIEKSTNTPTPEEAMRQVTELLQSLGYDGLGVGLIAPLGDMLNPMNYIPREPGWRLEIVPVKARSKGDS
jgi:hypothetical protein